MIIRYYNNFFLHYGDITDSISVFSIINKIKPDEIYNLAAQSHVAVSFDLPEYTTNADALGTLRILESITRINKKIKFYQAGSSEMYGKVFETPQSEKTPFSASLRVKLFFFTPTVLLGRSDRQRKIKYWKNASKLP